jgi:hypothetical protein
MMLAISAGLRFIASVAAGGQPSFSRQPLGRPPAPLTWPSHQSADLFDFALQKGATLFRRRGCEKVAPAGQVGWCEFSALLFSPLCWQCSIPGMTSLFAAP